MKNIGLFCLWLISFSFLLPAQSLPPALEVLMIRGASLVDIETGTLSPKPMDIWIVQDRMVRIVPSGTIKAPASAQVFDARGKFVIPGLWDMHAHPDDPEVWRMNPAAADRDWLIPQFVLYGVTGIRDMAGNLEVVKDWRARIRAGTLLGPEIIAGGPLLDGPNPMWDGSVAISSPDQVKPVVDSLIDAGVDFLKVYSRLPRDTYFALAEYAHEIHFPFAGHVPMTVSPSEAAQTGMKSQEHLLEILLECSDKRNAIQADTLDYGETGTNGFERYLYRNRIMRETFNPQKAKELYQLFIANQTWHTPTLSMWYKNAWFEQELTKDSALFKYLPPYLRTYWTPAHNDHLRYRDNKAFLTHKREEYAMFLRITGEMHKAGVKLLAGTDMGANPLCWPGIGVHNELAQLVAAGLTPAEALKTATLHPAQFLEIEKDYGTVAVGKIADLVILNKNPLFDIQAVRNIHAVVRKGKLINAQTRKEMLEQIARELSP